jgi:hypothetical protein
MGSSSGGGHSPLATPSILNWDKTAKELLRSRTNPSGRERPSAFLSGQEGGEGSGDKVVEIFKVDDVAMFVPNYCPTSTDYYVVL